MVSRITPGRRKLLERYVFRPDLFPTMTGAKLFVMTGSLDIGIEAVYVGNGMGVLVKRNTVTKYKVGDRVSMKSSWWVKPSDSADR